MEAGWPVLLPFEIVEVFPKGRVLKRFKKSPFAESPT